MGSGSGGDARLLKTELDSLKGFKAQVDELLTFLQGSWAAPQRIAEGHLTPAQLGSGFAEVDSLNSAYNEVHGQLKTLSQLLNDQIEALGTAVHAARVGYANVDADLRNRMWAIQARTKELYVPGLDPNARAARSRAATAGTPDAPAQAPTPAPTPADTHGDTAGGI